MEAYYDSELSGETGRVVTAKNGNGTEMLSRYENYYDATDGNNLNMRGGPGTDYDKIGQVPASTGVTALGTNEDGSWVVVNYNGTYGWLKTEFLNG